MSISSIGQSILNYSVRKTSPLFNKLAENKRISNGLEKSITDKARFASQMLVLSIVTKDLVNCFLYTYQSANNKKIPEDKRKFVASVDAMNGLVMVGGQLLIGKLIDQRLIPKLKSIFTGTIDVDGKAKNVGKNATSKIFHEDNIRNIALNASSKLNISENDVDIEKVIKNVAKKTKEPFLEGFGIIITTLATTAIVKRMIAPLISTPLAGLINDKLLKQKGDAKKDNRMTYEWIAVETSKYDQPKQKTNRA